LLDELGVFSKVLRRNAPLFAGAAIAVVTAKLFKKPLRSLAVAVTRGTLDISDRVTSTAGSIKKNINSIVVSAREEVKMNADRKTKVDPVYVKEQTEEPKENQDVNTSVKVESPESDL